MVVLTVLMFAIVALQQPETMSLLEKPLYAPPLSKDERASREAALADARATYAKDKTNADAILALARAQMALGLVGDSLETLTHGVESQTRRSAPLARARPRADRDPQVRDGGQGVEEARGDAA